jgi:pimeloyl-ACP methyl ester carboxylesterase
MIAWDEELCERLVERGFFVIRYDNRDIGLSTKFDDGPQPDLTALLSGDGSSAPYLLADMADDAVGLLDALGIARAHIVGASMGGMIVQSIAIAHPERVLSVCSVMSTTGARDVGQPTPEAMGALLVPPADSREQAIEQSVAGSRVISSTGYPFDEERVRERAGAAYDRSYNPAGMGRQLAAILASPDRTEALGHVELPTVVIHGDIDPLVTLSGGQATAAAIPGA